MSFFSWLRNTASPGPQSRTRRQPAGRRSRPRLEALEDRWLPSTLTVTSPKDQGVRTLRAEIAAANANDVIVISSKLDGQTITLTSGELDITKNLTILGPGAGQLKISGNNSSRVFEVAPNTTVTLSGLAITGGDGAVAPGSPYNPLNGYGGGILNQGALTVSDCAVSNNGGGGLSITAQVGGGIYNAPGATLAVKGGTVSGNGAGVFGGGIDNDGTLTVSGAVISGNSAERGGGICNFGAATVSSSTVSNDSADDGGGIYNAGAMTVSGCTLTANGAGDVGGGVLNGGTLAVSGCTISGNTLGPYGRAGGGIYNAGTAGALTVTNSIFSYNYAGNIFGPYTDGGGNTFI